MQTKIKMTKTERERRVEIAEEKEETPKIPNDMDAISDISKETTIILRKKKQKTRKNVSVTIEVITKLDKVSIQKLQQQRETFITQNIAASWAIRVSLCRCSCCIDTLSSFVITSIVTDTFFLVFCFTTCICIAKCHIHIHIHIHIYIYIYYVYIIHCLFAIRYYDHGEFLPYTL